MNNKTTAQLKLDAKSVLNVKIGEAIALTLIPGLISTAISYVIISILGILVPISQSSVYQTSSEIYNMTLLYSYLAGIIAGLLILPISVGALFTFLDLIRDRNRQVNFVEDLGQVFKKKQVGTILLIGILQFCIIFIGFLLFFIPGIIASYALSQSYYVFKDKTARGEHVTASDCLRESNQLMNGHKMRLFTLQLSFILWSLLIIVTCGIAAIYVSPYISLTEAAFYNDLVGQSVDDSSSSNSSNITGEDLRFFVPDDRYNSSDRYSNGSPEL